MPPSTDNPGVTVAMDEITGKALAKDPAERYQTAAEMAAAVERARPSAGSAPDGPAAAPVPVTAPLTEVPEPGNGQDSDDRASDPSVVPAPARRAMGVAALAVAVLVLSAVGLYYVFARDAVVRGGVPDVVGMSVSAAEGKLRAAGLEPELKKVEGPADSNGNVVRQRPRGGSKVAPGLTVVVEVNVGTASTENKEPTMVATADATPESSRAGPASADQADQDEQTMGGGSGGNADTSDRSDPSSSTKSSSGATSKSGTPTKAGSTPNPSTAKSKSPTSKTSKSKSPKAKSPKSTSPKPGTSASPKVKKSAKPTTAPRTARPTPSPRATLRPKKTASPRSTASAKAKSPKPGKPSSSASVQDG